MFFITMCMAPVIGEILFYKANKQTNKQLTTYIGLSSDRDTRTIEPLGVISRFIFIWLAGCCSGCCTPFSQSQYSLRSAW